MLKHYFNYFISGIPAIWVLKVAQNPIFFPFLLPVVCPIVCITLKKQRNNFSTSWLRVPPTKTKTE